MENSLPLNVCHIKKTQQIIYRLQFLLHGIALLALFYYRITSLTAITKTRQTYLLLPHFLLFISELILSFIWLLSHASKLRPVTRTVYPDRLPGDEKLPSVDVFICTADPNKEPCLDVMNTVISALALDYPPNKLHVYLSDDGGSLVTYCGTKEAWKFSKFWIPFCRKYEVKNSCPEAYFLREESDRGMCVGSEFWVDKKRIEGLLQRMEIRFVHQSWEDLTRWASQKWKKRKTPSHVIPKMCLGAAVYLIWRERNERTFGTAAKPKEMLLGDICSHLNAIINIRWKGNPHIASYLDCWS